MLRAKMPGSYLSLAIGLARQETGPVAQEFAMGSRHPEKAGVQAESEVTANLEPPCPSPEPIVLMGAPKGILGRDQSFDGHSSAERPGILREENIRVTPPADVHPSFVQYLD
jgi:hypothetical protein